MVVPKMTRATSALISHGVEGIGTEGLSVCLPEGRAHEVRARDLVFPDKVKVRPTEQISTDVLAGLAKHRTEVDDDGVLVREYAFDGNLYVGTGPSGSLISGSLRTWADKVGLVRMDTLFGPSEVGRVLNELAGRYGLSVPSVRSAWLSAFEAACDSDMDRPVAEYARSLADMPRATTHRSGDTTVRYETTNWDLITYAKASHRLRIEVRYKKPATLFGRRLRAGQLADPSFRDDLARRWVARARSIPVRREPRADRRPLTYRDRVHRYALGAMEEAGGLDAALAEVRADYTAGRITAAQRRSQARDLRTLWANADHTETTDLAAEVAAAIDHVDALL